MSSKCLEREAFILHLFSAFIWAIADYVSVENFHPAAVVCSREIYAASHVDLVPVADKNSRPHPQLKSNQMEMFVQELQSMGLGTSKEIYKVLIPPLSCFSKLPNEAVADWCNESLITQEVRTQWQETFDGYIDLLDVVQRRNVQDRFANRVAAMIIGFLLRMKEDFKPFNDYIEPKYIRFKEKLENKNVIKTTILSLKPILIRQGRLRENEAILTKLGFEDLQVQSPPSAHASRHKDFTFPNATDVFGWTKGYWNIFNDKGRYENDNTYKTLDLAGQSVLHHAINKFWDNTNLNVDRKLQQVICGFHDRRLFEDSEQLKAKCNNQTPLHRAARVRDSEIVRLLLYRSTAGLKARDSYGRTPLCLAAYHGNIRVIDLLCEKSDQESLDQVDNQRLNALHHAILNHKEGAALKLIEHKININCGAWLGWTPRPLWLAAQKGLESVVESLLQSDQINVIATGESDGLGRPTTPQEEAKQAGHEKIAEMIRIWREKQESMKQKEMKEEQGPRMKQLTLPDLWRP